jgi:4-amino-4-deoxy-L-arabinose transferase-like glycosyltransferase
MSLARRDPTAGPRATFARFLEPLLAAPQRFVVETAEGTIVLAALIAFAALWMLFDTVSTASVDAHWDVSEATLWAQHFAFGYKHPPLTAWLFGLWFAVFPRQHWAAHLLNVTVITAALAVTWRLLRDHLDRNRAMFGLAALFVIPLYNLKTEILNANVVMMPFWAAALLFYLRARRGLSVVDSLLAGAFAGGAVLGKYWALFLLAGMAVAAVLGAGARRFWRSPAPYAMAAGAALVIAPHAIWFVLARGGADYAFLHDSVVVSEPFSAVVVRSAYYLLGAVAYAIGPLLFLAALQPSKATLADIVWPAQDDRRQALLLFAVPLLLPALVNLLAPYRLTPDWTFPNWALLPVILYGARDLKIDARAVAGAGLVAFAATLVAVIASPVVAYERLAANDEPCRQHFREIAARANQLAGRPVERFWGSACVTGGLPFYLPGARPLPVDPLSAAGRAESRAYGLIVVCLAEDAACRNTAAALAKAGARTSAATLRRTFLGVAGQPLEVQFAVVPPEAERANQ